MREALREVVGGIWKLEEKHLHVSREWRVLRQSLVLQGILLVAKLSDVECIGSQACEVWETRIRIGGRPTVAGLVQQHGVAHW